MSPIPDRRRGQISLAIVGALAAAAVGATVVIGQERTVADAEHRLEEQSQAIDGGETPPVTTLPVTGSGYPARARIADALLLARRAASLPRTPARAALLARASIEVAIATEARPYWGEAWAVTAYVAALREGPASPATRRALVRSYDDAPFLRHSAAWRARLGFALWPVLGQSTRERLDNEAVWIARIDLSTREPMFAAARQSPGYDLFLGQWRLMRERDAGFRG